MSALEDACFSMERPTVSLEEMEGRLAHHTLAQGGRWTPEGLRGALQMHLALKRAYRADVLAEVRPETWVVADLADVRGRDD